MDIEHPDIEFMNRTGHTRDQWCDIHSDDDRDDRDRSEWDD
jgi:hypothetical protein